MKNTYRILLVVRWPIGGIRTFFRYFYRNFDSRKYAFTLIAPDLAETKVLLNDLSRLDVRYIQTRKDISSKIFFKEVNKIILTEKFDLIHSHGFTSGVASVAGSVLRKIPHILTLHETLDAQRFDRPWGGINKIILGIALSLVNRIHCVSYDARDNLLSYLSLLIFFKEKLTVIPLGVEVDRFKNAEKINLRLSLGLPEESFLIGFLGRYMPEKGFRYLVDALEKIIEREVDIKRKPIILSFNEEDGFIREEKDNIELKGLKDRVLFLPFVENVAPILKSLDVVVMPSLREACPLLPMEVMIAGTPFIGTNCIGLREILKNTPAAVVPPKNSLALSDALIHEMQTPTTSIAQEFVSEAAVRFEVRDRARDLEILLLKFLEK